MTNREPRDVGASIRQRLLNLARERGDDFQLVLTRYALERLLYRLGRTEHRDRFVLKGATLFAAWFETPYRATRDLDLLGRGESSAESILVLFQELCAIATPEDGLDFQADTVQAGEIMDAQEYEGLRVTMTALLAGARIPIQVDIGFGDAVTPGTEELELPTLLDHPRPRVLAYPPESVIAEKLQAMVTLGVANSRMKDFYDVAALAQKRGFKGRVLCEAIRATFGRRGTALPENCPTFPGQAIPPRPSWGFCCDCTRCGAARGFHGLAFRPGRRALHQASTWAQATRTPVHVASGTMPSQATAPARVATASRTARTEPSAAPRRSDRGVHVA